MKLFGPPDIGKLKAKQDVKGLIQVLRTTRDPGLQAEAARALCSLGTLKKQDAADALLAAVYDPDGYVREIALLALYQVHDRRAVHHLLRLLRDQDQPWFMRWRAASTLGDIGDSLAVEPLIAVLKGQDPEGDTDAQLRSAAAGALARIGDPRAVQPLIAALKDPHALVRGDAAAALAFMGAPAVEPLIAALKDQTEFSRSELASHKGMGGRRTVRVTVGRDAARALGQIGDPRAVAPLIVALHESHEEVRRAAGAALVQIGGPAVEPLISALGDPDPHVRQASAEVLMTLYKSGKLDEKEKTRILAHQSVIADAGVGFGSAPVGK